MKEVPLQINGGKQEQNLKKVDGQIAQLSGTQNKRDQIPNSTIPKGNSRCIKS